MPFEPTAAIWGSLLGACRVHSNTDIGEFVGCRLLEIEPENAGNYVILSNLYASAGRWEDVRNVRELMMEKAVIKEPGRSWIELDQTLHTFYASDRSHPRREEVFLKARELLVKFKESGYVPDQSCVLYDVDEEQKEKILLGHSEKLALAFGLISTSEGVPLRVIKNLRICVDCHNFAKFVSKVYGRRVSIRDKNRFHHIAGGICSCGDYCSILFDSPSHPSPERSITGRWTDYEIHLSRSFLLTRCLMACFTITAVFLPAQRLASTENPKQCPSQRHPPCSATASPAPSEPVAAQKPVPSRWTSPGHEERPKGHFLNRTPPPPGQSRQWEDWELPCYITSFLTIVILGVGLNAKPDLTIETWAHQKALERLEMEKLGLSGSAGSE
ncbi:hypothetical protein OIU78_019889 [Salix suchowensis]|nr:hypothetical protein OIU78_019889 [Salix suchowensis]